MKKVILPICIVMLHFNIFGANPVFPVKEIPDSLKTEAYAIVRSSKTIFTYKTPSSGSQYRYLALTVLNKNGDESAIFNEYYDKFRNISGLKIIIYDASGKKIKTVKTDEIIDNSVFTGSETLITDGRFKAFRPVVNSYPYTIVTEYTVNYKGILGIPAWYPQTDNNISVQQSTYILKVASGLNVNIKEENCSHSNAIENNQSVYTWEASNIKAFETELHMPRKPKHVISATIVPLKFEMDGKQGSMESWQSFGKWVNDLNNQENKISEKTRTEILNLTKDATSDYEKVKILYKYLQNKTRYVSINLGIGGWKPMDASVTDQFGYGDCKALSNYLQVLLKEVGVNSIYTYIYAGTIPEYDIPKNFFNHALITVPLANDTLFLECTNQHVPFGFLGRSTSDRQVLLITSDGGKLVYNKKYTAEQNLQSRRATVQFDSKGIAKIKVNTAYQGLQYENIFSVIYAGAEDQKKWMYKYVNIPSINIKSYRFSPDDKTLPVGNLEFEAEVSDYLTISSKRVFLPLNLMNRNEATPSTTKARKFDFELTYPYTDVDTINYILPTGLKIESVPADIDLKTKYGEYRTKTFVNGDTIQYVRFINSKTGLFPASEFSNFADYMKKVAKADAAKIALLRN